MSETSLPLRPHQDPELIYALDIGTRSVIGMLGRQESGRVRILAVEKLLHTHRVMQDGQIEDIAQVAAAVQTVTRRLEQDMGCRLERACVAAAGRALRTEQGRSQRELSAPESVTAPILAQLEAAAVAEAEQSIRADGPDGQQLLLVGYTATRYQLDGYPLSTLLGHTGRKLEAQVVATFLPGGVIDSLYAVMRQAGLEVASLTLEPIAALNAAIPADLRLLNLCLVDIGAGTSDIAVCRDGSVVGYTMATVAGDEITEAFMRAFLVDYATAENMKAQLSRGESLTFTDILAQEQTCSVEQALAVLEPAGQQLADEIARQVVELNGAPPSALFLAGGGSKLSGLREQLAAALDMDVRRVAVAGGHFKATVYSDIIDLEDPEYTTPLGIAVSAGLGLISDSCQVTLNGNPAKLFRSSGLTAMDLLMMNGYTYFDLLGKTGKPLIVQVDGRRTVFHGQPAHPAVLRINDAEAQPSSPVRAGDRVDFMPRQGRAMTAVSPPDSWPSGWASRPLPSTDRRSPRRTPCLPALLWWLCRNRSRSQSWSLSLSPAAPSQPSPPSAAGISFLVHLNGRSILLPPKADGAPYYVMDLLERSGLDFKQVDRPVALRLNGAECLFQQVLQPGDRVDIGYEDEVKSL